MDKMKFCFRRKNVMRKLKHLAIIFLIVDIFMAAVLSLLIKCSDDDEDSEDDIFSEMCPNEEYI